jgi:biotin transport system substrate-specific component
MTPSSSTAVLAPRRLADLSPVYQLLAVLLGTGFLTLGSWVQVPMFPVPMTMQTFAVTLVGALYGSRLGGLTVLAWLGEALLGMPVLAGGTGGLAPFVGPTAGYLFAFPVIAVLVGVLAERGWTAKPWMSFAVMCLGNALCLAIGACWLATLVGVEKAWMAGVAPFILGGVLKSALGASSIEIARRVGSALQRP